MDNRSNELVVYDEYKKLAAELIKSTLIPKSFKVMQDAWYALLYGRELGLSPIYSLNNVTVINGKPSLSADAMLAIVKRSPEYGGIEIDASDTACTVKLKRVYGNGVVDMITGTFTIEDAKKAGLYNSPGQMYQKYPKRMLRARAVSFACRDGFGDIFAGSYTPEELNGGDDSDTPHKQEIVVPEIAETAPTTPQATPIAIAQAVKACNDMMMQFSLVSSHKEEIDARIKEAAKNGDISELDGIRDELTALKAKAEASSKPKAKKEKAETVTDAEFTPVDNAELNKARADIVNAFGILAKEKVDRFDQPNRKIESMKKHLDGCDDLSKCTDIPKMKEYQEHLRDKYRNKDKPSLQEQARKAVEALPVSHVEKEQAVLCLEEAEQVFTDTGDENGYAVIVEKWGK